jgi:ferredoxin-NADP reductase
MSAIREICTELMAAIPRTEGVMSFRFRDPGGISFRPGQFFQLFLKTGAGEESHYFSFSNSPTEKGYFEFTKRLSRSSFSQALRAITPGTAVRMKLPLGRFVFEGNHPYPAFLSGGIGITPIRSICRYLADTSASSDAVVLYTARTEKAIIFREDFDEMAAKNPRLRFIYSVTDEAPPPGWRGRTGRLGAEMVRSELPDYSRRLFFVCGPPGMVAAIASTLKDELKIPAEKVMLENFAGY